MDTLYSDSILVAKEFVDTQAHPERAIRTLETEGYQLIVAFKEVDPESTELQEAKINGQTPDSGYEIDLIVNGMEPRMAAEVLLRMAMDFYKNALMAESPVADFIGKALDAGVPPEVLAEFMADMAEKAQAAA